MVHKSGRLSQIVKMLTHSPLLLVEPAIASLRLLREERVKIGLLRKAELFGSLPLLYVVGLLSLDGI